MIRITMVLFALVMAGVARGTAICTFTSRPGRATVAVDGEIRGMTPDLVLRDLAPDVSHHVRFTRDGFEPFDAFVTPHEGDSTLCHADLKPVKGLLLVTSEPAGAEISLDGYSLGETPRIVTVLDAKESYRLQLRRNGYQDRRLDVKFDGRKPLILHVKLPVDSGTIEFATEPEGAEVTVNGVVRGKTPLKVEGVPRGSATVVVRKQGYREVTRILTVSAGSSQRLDLPLEGEPGRLRLTSVPAGARFYINGRNEGAGPYILPPGVYDVRAELEGFATVSRQIAVGHGAEVSEEFRLQNILGQLEIRTSPVGASVYVDQKLQGDTTSSDPAAEVSDALVVSNLSAGDHLIVVRAPGCAEKMLHFKVEAQRSLSVPVVRLKRVFKPDLRIETTSRTILAVKIRDTRDQIVVQEKPGIDLVIPRETIRKIEYLGLEP